LPGSPERDRQRVPGSCEQGRDVSPRQEGLSLLAILGPTGTGKSELAVRLAEELEGEIIGCDALQVYLGLDAATAKPSAEQRARVPHHLVDCIDPRLDFNMADYVREAERLISEIDARGRLPIVAGGSGMYLRGLLRGVVDAPPRDTGLRQRLRAIAERKGTPSMHRWLSRRDPDSAERIAPGDTQRLLRAMELLLSGDLTWSERLSRQGSWASGEDRYRALKIGLDMERTLLVGRIDARAECFMGAGLVEEIEHLLRDGVPRTANAFKAIGYREVLSARGPGFDAAAVVEEIKRNTRRYAKRQRTWFRKEPGVVWLDAAEDIDRLVARVVMLYSRSPSDG
jgi:tRNA dimethylallyltransferase